MNRDGLLKHLLVGFSVALALYLVAYESIQHLRTRKGAWQVTFQSDAHGSPEVVISQPYLQIAQVRFNFPGTTIPQTNLATTVIFDRPITNVPFGRVVYFDTTFLPGAIVFNFFGHEIQLVPRVLVVDHKEVPWQSGTTHEIIVQAK